MNIVEFAKLRKMLGGGTGGGGSGGGDSPTPCVAKKDVNFYDYDGTLLHSYTVAEAKSLKELPELPTQPGLICQGWNYDLDTIKAYDRAVDVGATYITDDGKTRLYIKIDIETRKHIVLYFTQTVANGVTIDWGDGSDTKTVGGTGGRTAAHTYAETGDYVVSFEVAENCTLTLGTGSSSGTVLGSVNEPNRTILKKVEMGSGITTLINYAFNTCYGLESVTIPNSVTSIGEFVFSNCYCLESISLPNSVTSIAGYTFNYCHGLKSISLPNSTTSMGNFTFSYCYCLESISLPNSVTSIGGGTFQHCCSLASITIPAGVTSIGTNAFADCKTLVTCDLSSHLVVPTLSGANAFSRVASDFKVKVPAALYDEWVAATNWATYASQIVAV